MLLYLSMLDTQEEKDKFTEIYEHYQHFCWYVANGILHDEHLTEDLDIRDLASAAFVSVNTLERHFRQALQDTPFRILRKKRLFAATQLLRMGSPVYEAAAKSGFSDYSHFIVLFRKHFGITPLQYQKLFLSV